ncbi:tetraacyldisaccharide 4'-kinase [Thalassospiraceae bacterium LMO-SO8]|nr:tetraacyldisaccharide 4'-kinase [Alphaproteobacteria bacterium LMO-S08]WND77940.1 tetraacyldisaccharide 4'-kinase [Thalassospiraceae bacterium LMO-SO8]
MKAPAFWYDAAPSALGAVLSPLGLIYGAATALRQRGGRPAQAGVPVVCVGNLTAGGAGKTPVVIDIARRLATAGRRPHVVSRGYGGQADATPRPVDPDADTADKVGDEPLMIAKAAPVWVGGDRAQAARTVADAGAGTLVLDDGFQDPSLAKDLSIVVVDGRYGFGNGFLIPAGPLRETLRAGLARADALVVIGDDAWGVGDAARRFGPKNLPLLTARVVPGSEIGQISKSLGVAFAGIGHPEKFFQTLRDHGCRLAGTQAFPDHHPFSSADLAALKRRAEALKGVLITTEKDAQRIPAGDRAGIEVLTITLQWDDEAALDRLLQNAKP